MIFAIYRADEYRLHVVDLITMAAMGAIGLGIVRPVLLFFHSWVT